MKSTIAHEAPNPSLHQMHCQDSKVVVFNQGVQKIHRIFGRIRKRQKDRHAHISPNHGDLFQRDAHMVIFRVCHGVTAAAIDTVVEPHQIVIGLIAAIPEVPMFQLTMRR